MGKCQFTGVCKERHKYKQDKLHWIKFRQDQKLIDSNKIDPKKIINHKTLLDLGLVKSNKTRIKLLAKGEIKNKIDIEVSAFSNSAKEIIEKAGGSIIVLDNKRIDKKAKKSED